MDDPRRAGLIALLEGFRPDAPDAVVATRATLEHVRGRAMPFDRDDFAPGHVTASGYVLHPDGGAILLILHRTVGRWIQPGGHVDAGDPSPLEAARREIREETGLDGLDPLASGGLIDVDVHAYPARRGGDPAHEHFDLRFGYRATSDRFVVTDEIDDARWVGPDDLEALERSVLRPAAVLLGLS